MASTAMKIQFLCMMGAERPGRVRIFCLTAEVLVDAARIAFAREPDFPYDERLGGGDLVTRLRCDGHLGLLRRSTNNPIPSTTKYASYL